MYGVPGTCPRNPGVPEPEQNYVWRPRNLASPEPEQNYVWRPRNPRPKCDATKLITDRRPADNPLLMLPMPAQSERQACQVIAPSTPVERDRSVNPIAHEFNVATDRSGFDLGAAASLL